MLFVIIFSEVSVFFCNRNFICIVLPCSCFFICIVHVHGVAVIECAVDVITYASLQLVVARLIVLNDGTIMIESNGGDEDWSYSYTVFEVQGYSLVQVSELEIYSWPDDDYNYQSEYTYNGEQITEEQSDALIAQYISQMSYAVVWNQYYDSEWYESGDWAETVMSLPSNHISYDEAVSQLS